MKWQKFGKFRNVRTNVYFDMQVSKNFGTLLKNQSKIKILVIPTTTFENVPLLRGFDPRRRQIFFLIFLFFF